MTVAGEMAKNTTSTNLAEIIAGKLETREGVTAKLRTLLARTDKLIGRGASVSANDHESSSTFLAQSPEV